MIEVVSVVCFLLFRHAQSLAVVKAYSMWLTQFYVQTRRDVNNTTNSAQCDAMIANALEATLPLLTSNQHVSFHCFIVLKLLYHCWRQTNTLVSIVLLC